MTVRPVIVSNRRKYNIERLSELRDKVAQIDELSSGAEGLCIYVTGSYGRSEASEHSDLDLFFVQDRSIASNSMSRIKKTLIDAELIKICRSMDFVEFSGDGKYLEIHDIEDILYALGSPDDDHKNYFTARMLLLLESSPIYNDDLYEKIAEKIIKSYYRDYHDHEATFRPVFLVNDVIRFWKTLCLNYEHRRNRPDEDSSKKNFTHLKNLKLKFSRMMTCFSTVMVLARNREVVTPSRLVELVHEPPVERLIKATDNVQNSAALLADILEDYSWFLSTTDKPKEELIIWISDVNNRDDAFDRARKFHQKMYDLLLLVAQDTDTLRYIVI